MRRTAYCLPVLIETYWNVNTFTLIQNLSSGLGLNRNILECKCDLALDGDPERMGLNRNILECKYQR